MEEILTVLFMLVVGFGTLFLSFKRSAIVWAVIATIMFAVLAVTGLAIPFATDASGNLIPSSINYLLFGFSLIFAFLGLIQSIRLAFGIFTATRTTTQ